MAKKDPIPLSKDEIEEELLNDNLIDAVGVGNESQLQSMSMEEKKALLKGIRQSKDESSSEPVVQSSLSLDGFPSLPAAGKKESQNRLKLPRKAGTLGKVEEKININLSLSSDEDCKEVFSLPHCIADGASPLVSQRHIKSMKDPYMRMKHESDNVALKRMISHHNQWKELYVNELIRIKTQGMGKDNNYTEDIERQPSKSYKLEEKENDPYTFISDSPKGSPKPLVDQRKGETRLDSGISPHMNNQQGQRKTNRDSDCEEIEPILKNEEPKGNVSEWRNAPRSKRNRKQLPVRQDPEGSPEVQFDFDNQWDAGTSSWRGAPPGGPGSSQPLSPAHVEEEKVQCPICQKDFAKSKVENHAATCEGYSDSPMDVEES